MYFDNLKFGFLLCYCCFTECYSNAPEYVWGPVGHSSACWRDEDYMYATLSCGAGTVWSDTMTVKKVMTCDCQTGYPPSLTSTCVGNVKAYTSVSL